MIAVGEKEEIRNSQQARIRQFLDRVPDKMGENQQEFLSRLTEN